MTAPSSAAYVCPVCKGDQVIDILQINQLPVLSNVLYKTREEAVNVEKADIHLSFCRACGHVFNHAFQPEKIAYMENYENSLHFSPRFQEYAATMADELIERYQLRGKDILEIGSGRGDFIKLLVSKGQNRGTGFDPSYPGPGNEEQVEGIRFIQDYYSEHYKDFPADFIVCRHALEHIFQPQEFLSKLRNAIGSQQETVIFFEVPNAAYTLEGLGIWDLIYEHYSYFTASSLKEIFCLSGFDVIQVCETFSGQFLTIEAKPGRQKKAGSPPDPSLLEKISQASICFGENYRLKLLTWQNNLNHFRHDRLRTVIWGSGSKGISFLNSFASGDLIQYAVDINPRKQGMYISGTGQKIVSPDFLAAYQPDIVIVMNPNYLDEVSSSLRRLGIDAQVLLA